MKIDAPPTTAAADAPIHPRTRRALRATFANTAPRVEEQYGDIVRRRVDELVTRVAARRGEVVDLIPYFATELPLLVIVDILGVPPQRHPGHPRWADGQIALIWGQPEPRRAGTAGQRAARLLALLPGPGGQPAPAWTATATTSSAGPCVYRGGDDAVLTEDEVASLAFNLLVAGHETTAGLLAHALDQALSDAGTMAADRGRPGHRAGVRRGDPAVRAGDRRLAAGDLPAGGDRRSDHPGRRALPADHRRGQPGPGGRSPTPTSSTRTAPTAATT